MEAISRQRHEMEKLCDATLDGILKNISPDASFEMRIKILKEELRKSGIYIITEEHLMRTFDEILLAMSLTKIDNIHKSLAQVNEIKSYFKSEMGILKK